MAVTDNPNHRHIQRHQLVHGSSTLTKGVDLALRRNHYPVALLVLGLNARIRHRHAAEAGLYMEILLLSKGLEHAHTMHPVGIRRNAVLHFNNGHISAGLRQEQCCLAAHQTAAHHRNGFAQRIKVRIGSGGMLCRFNTRQWEYHRRGAQCKEQCIRLDLRHQFRRHLCI